MSAAVDDPCCVPGCESLDAPHNHTFVVEVGGWGGELETSSRFCCLHFDMLAQEGPPFLDLKVIGVVREAKE